MKIPQQFSFYDHMTVEENIPIYRDPTKTFVLDSAKVRFLLIPKSVQNYSGTSIKIAKKFNYKVDIKNNWKKITLCQYFSEKINFNGEPEQMWSYDSRSALDFWEYFTFVPIYLKVK